MPRFINLSEICDGRIAAARDRDGALPAIPRMALTCTELNAEAQDAGNRDALSAVGNFLTDSQKRLLVLLGQYGTGKSWLMRWLAASGRGAAVLALLTTQTEVAQSFVDERLEDTVRRKLEQTSRAAGEEFARLVAVEPSRTMILIDGCDEPLDATLETEPNHSLRRLVPLVGSNLKVVVAARPTLLAGPARVAEEVRLQPGL